MRGGVTIHPDLIAWLGLPRRALHVAVGTRVGFDIRSNMKPSRVAEIVAAEIERFERVMGIAVDGATEGTTAGTGDDGME